MGNEMGDHNETSEHTPKETTRNYTGRIQIGRKGEDELRLILEAYGFMVKPTGQENWLPVGIHRHIRHNHSDTMARAVRYMPDFLVYHPVLELRFFAYWDAKVNVTAGTENFSIEKACYEEFMARVGKGERVVVAFKDVDGQWYANWVEALVIQADMSSLRHAANGAQTPYLLVAKSSVRCLNDFLMH